MDRHHQRPDSTAEVAPPKRTEGAGLSQALSPLGAYRGSVPPAPPSLSQLELSGRGGHFVLGPATIQYLAEPDGTILLASLRVPRDERRNGHAERVMKAFLGEVDREGRAVSLLASPLDARTKLGRLVEFYRRHGFVTTGRAGNPAGDPWMVRKPAFRVN